MSGSSLDGLDIAFTQLTEISGQWSFELLNAECIPYPAALVADLQQANKMSVPDFLRLHTSFGHYLGEQIVQFIDRNNLHHKVHFISSHGHTVWHEPNAKTTSQIGDGAAIAAWTMLPTVTDLRNMDIALGGQGAPIVPIADRLLFSDYDFCLNLGGIANVTVNTEEPIAFDIAPANQLLNHFANKASKAYDDKGEMARAGTIDAAVWEQINAIKWYQKEAPKSLHNDFVNEAVLPFFDTIKDNEDALHTATRHIAFQIAEAIKSYQNPLQPQRILVTGGGAFNQFLLECIDEELNKNGTMEVIVPEENSLKFKEAIAMALIGALRWREETNVLHSATGATRSNVGGAMWLPAVD